MRGPHTAMKSSRCSLQLEKACMQQQRPSTAQKKLINYRVCQVMVLVAGDETQAFKLRKDFWKTFVSAALSFRVFCHREVSDEISSDNDELLWLCIMKRTDIRKVCTGVSKAHVDRRTIPCATRTSGS